MFVQRGLQKPLAGTGYADGPGAHPALTSLFPIPRAGDTVQSFLLLLRLATQLMRHLTEIVDDSLQP